jgi:hypothetical protein
LYVWNTEVILLMCNVYVEYMKSLSLINPLPVQFKSPLHGQEGCVFFSGHLNLRTCQYVWVRLARPATFKSSTFWYVRAGKGLRESRKKKDSFWEMLVHASNMRNNTKWREVKQLAVEANSHMQCCANAIPLPCHVTLIHTCRAVPLPFSDSGVSFVKIHMVAWNTWTSSPTV